MKNCASRKERKGEERRGEQAIQKAETEN